MNDKEPLTGLETEFNETSTAVLETLIKKKPKANKTYGECPLLYPVCSSKPGIRDANCVGDHRKFSGCHFFIELGISSPPKGIDCDSNVSQKIEERNKRHLDLQTRYDTAKQELREKQKQLEGCMGDLKEFRQEYFIH